MAFDLAWPPSYSPVNFEGMSAGDKGQERIVGIDKSNWPQMHPLGIPNPNSEHREWVRDDYSKTHILKKGRCPLREKQQMCHYQCGCSITLCFLKDNNDQDFQNLWGMTIGLNFFSHHMFWIFILRTQACNLLFLALMFYDWHKINKTCNKMVPTGDHHAWWNKAVSTGRISYVLLI